MQVLSIQPTPNPNAYKFVVDRQLLDEGSRHYNTADEAQGDALAVAVFAVPGITTLYFAENFVTVTTAGDCDWRAMHELVKGVLESHFAEAEDTPGDTSKDLRAQGASPESASAGTDADDPDLLRQINEILDDRVRPALAGDGGGLEILSLQNKSLSIRYQGACGSCPSSIAGTLKAIENLLQMEVDEGLTVVSA